MTKPRKGIGGTVRRLSLLPRRYGITSAKMRKRLREMIDFLQRIDITPTIPITAETLENHPELRSELETIDPALHGYRHVAYASLSASEQGRDLDAARRVFESHGLTARGFRAPYLAANETTRRLLSRAGFLYDSSTPQFVASSGDDLLVRAQRMASARYGAAIPTSVPVRIANGLVELPVALPDDEILVDGLGVTNPETISRVLSRMLDATFRERSQLVLQIHPERFPMFAHALRLVAKRADDLGAWRGCLSEIARRASSHRTNGGSSFFFAVTGDLDAATLWDFSSRFLRRV
jgi:polysaccharide deacetylase